MFRAVLGMESRVLHKLEDTCSTTEFHHQRNSFWIYGWLNVRMWNQQTLGADGQDQSLAHERTQVYCTNILTFY